MQMVAMTKNLVKAAVKAGVSKVIHLSSIAIYGKIPGPAYVFEAATPTPDMDDDYGIAKLRQDELLLNMPRRISVTLLCPANIYGPEPPFILRVAQCLRGWEVGSR